MPAARVPGRIAWAVETLAVDPSDQVLEIGCGNGLAASLVCDRLGRGRLLAIDRSAAMIAAARWRNRAHIRAGKAAFETLALADLDVGRRRFSCIFAINVNLFWLDPARELPVVRRALRPDGTLCLFYQPPSPAQLARLSAALGRNLRAGGFSVDRVILGRGSGAGSLCARATLSA